MRVNSSNSQFINSPIISGDNNYIVLRQLTDNIDWERLQNELIKVCGKMPESSDEYAVSKEALNCAMSKDEGKLRKTLRKYSPVFLSDFFSGVASGVLVEMISALLK